MAYRQMAELSDVLDLDVFNKLRSLFRENFASVITQHQQSTDENVKRIENAIQKGDQEALVRAAHSIKGSSAQFGSVRLNAIAVEMEALAKNSELEASMQMLSELRTAQRQAAQLMMQLATGDEAVMVQQSSEISAYRKTQPVFDYQAMSKHLLNDGALIRTVADSFLADMSRNMQQLRLAITAGDEQDILALVHKIKEASANVSAMAIIAIAEQIEVDAKVGDMEGLHQGLHAMEHGFAELKIEMAEKINLD